MHAIRNQFVEYTNGSLINDLDVARQQMTEKNVEHLTTLITLSFIKYQTFGKVKVLTNDVKNFHVIITLMHHHQTTK